MCVSYHSEHARKKSIYARGNSGATNAGSHLTSHVDSASGPVFLDAVSHLRKNDRGGAPRRQASSVHYIAKRARNRRQRGASAEVTESRSERGVENQLSSMNAVKAPTATANWANSVDGLSNR